MEIIIRKKKVKKEMKRMIEEFEEKGRELEKVIKIGRKKLKDEVKINIGKELEEFEEKLREEKERMEEVEEILREVKIGGKDIGKRIKEQKEYEEKEIEEIQKI